MYEISVRCDGALEQQETTTNADQAKKIFYKFARKRSRLPSQVLCTKDGDILLMYHIDDTYHANRWSICKSLYDGSNVKTRYIPSDDELIGRKGISAGKLISPIKVPLDVISKLNDIARATGRTLNDVRLDAYREHIKSSDTILDQVLEK